MPISSHTAALAPHLDAYRAHLCRCERSNATVEKYLRDLRRFFDETCAPAAPPKQTVAQWRDALAARGYAAASVNSMLASVNGYQRFLGRPQDCVRPLKQQRRVYRDAGRELNRGEYLRLLTAARVAHRTRILLVLQTICATGIRVSELQYITVESLRRRQAQVACKGKSRIVLLPAELCRRLRKWCAARRICTGSVFVTRSGRPLDRTAVWRQMKALCALANVAPGKVFPHNLRHLFARSFYALDKNLAKLADLLGHASIETTRIYIMESTSEHERMLNQMHLLL